MPPPSSLPPHLLRPARHEDIPQMIHILTLATSHGPWSRTLFPAPADRADQDEPAWRRRTTAAVLGRPGHRHSVAETSGAGAGATTTVSGWAHWCDRRDEGGAAGGEDHLPPGLDVAAWKRMRAEAAAVEGAGEAVLGPERWARALELHYLMVDPAHQRKGIGRMLVQEGLDRAAADGRDVWLRATPEGRPLYLALGFEEVGRGEMFGYPQYAMVKRASGGL